MAFMKTILDNGTPTGNSDANSSEEEAHHARISYRDDDTVKKAENNDSNRETDSKDETSKSLRTSDEEPDYSSFSDSDNDNENKEKTKKHRHRQNSDSQNSNYSSEGGRRVKRKPPTGHPTGHRVQLWYNAEPQSHQDMLEEKFLELRSLLTDRTTSEVDKHLLKKTRAFMKHYQEAQSGLIPGHNLTGHKSPRSKALNSPRSSNAWNDQEKDMGREYTNSTSPVTGEEYILIDGTGDEVKTRRVKFSDVETESIPDGHPSLDLLGSLGWPLPVAPSGPRPVRSTRSASEWTRKSRPRRKAASVERPRTKQERSKRRSATRSPSAHSQHSRDSRSRSRSRSSSSRSLSRSKSRSRSRSTKAAEDEKLKKTDHHLKDTDNKVLQDWLKKKEKAIKAKKKEERKRKKEKRDQKRKEYEEKEKLKKESEEVVRKWFVKKEEEQRLLQRRERVRRPLQKDEFSYSLELLTLTKSPDRDPDNLHTSNPEIDSIDQASGAPFVSNKPKKRRAKFRAKSAKVQSTVESPEPDGEDMKDRKSYDQWLEEKRGSERVEKEKVSEEEEKEDDQEEKEEEKKQEEENEENCLEDAADEDDEDEAGDVENDAIEEDAENFDNTNNKDERIDERHETEPRINESYDDEALLTDVGQRRDVNMNIKRKDSDSFDPYNEPKDYTLDNETRRNLMQVDSLEKEENGSSTKLESSAPSFRYPSPPLLSFSPVPKRETGQDNPEGIPTGNHEGIHVENPIGNPEGNPSDFIANVVPHPPRQDVPRSSAYRRIKREQATSDEFSDNVWTQLNEEETAEGLDKNPAADTDNPADNHEVTEGPVANPVNPEQENLQTGENDQLDDDAGEVNPYDKVPDLIPNEGNLAKNPEKIATGEEDDFLNDINSYEPSLTNELYDSIEHTKKTGSGNNGILSKNSVETQSILVKYSDSEETKDKVESHKNIEEHFERHCATDIDGDAAADEMFTSSVDNEETNPNEIIDETKLDSNAESVFIANEFAMNSDALHLNPIREETEIESENGEQNDKQENNDKETDNSPPNLGDPGKVQNDEKN